MPMTYYITSRGRVHNQITLNNLPPEIRDQVWLAVYESEAKEYRKIHPRIFVCPDQSHGLSWKRQFIMTSSKTDYICLLDDDIRFNKKRLDDVTKMVPADDQTVLDAFALLGSWLVSGDFAHVGMITRGGANRILTPYVETTRMMHVLAYNRRIFINEGIRFDRLICMSDFDVTLQLLEKGYNNRLLASCLSDPSKSNSTGGCSIYRTPDLLEESAHGLAKLHPLYVSTRLKITEEDTWKGFGGLRTDVTVQWKRCYHGS